MRAMILAAGYGNRMRPLTDHTPKPLLEAGGKPLIEYLIEGLARAGFRELVINTGWLGGQLPARLGDGERFGVHISWSHEGTPLETAGGILRALPMLGDEPFALVNGDIWTDYDFSRLHLDLAADHAHFHLTEQGRVRDNGASRLTYAGIACLHPALFHGLASGEQKLAPLLRSAMTAERVGGEHHRGQWWDIGTPRRLEQLDHFLRA